jgi:C4-dicarboxylate transporter DctQ subunit
MDEAGAEAARGNEQSGLERFMFILNRIAGGLSITAFSLMLIDVLAGVVMRYLLQVPFPWGEEMARYLMVLGIMSGIGIGIREGAHLNVDIFRSMLPTIPRAVVTLFADILTLTTYIFLIIISQWFISLNKSFGQVTAALNIPIYYIYYILLLGFLLAAVEHLYAMYNRFICRRGVNQGNEAKKEEFGI